MNNPTIISTVGNGFAIRDCSPEEIEAVLESVEIPDPDQDLELHQSICVLTLCPECDREIGIIITMSSKYNITKDGIMTTACPYCASPISIDFGTVCINLSTVLPQENHDQEIFIVLREMKEMGMAEWLDQMIQT